MVDAVESPEGKFRLLSESPNAVRIDFLPTPLPDALVESAEVQTDEPVWRQLVQFDLGSKSIRTYPIRTIPGPDVQAPKYRSLHEIVFEGFLNELPDNIESARSALASIPREFHQQIEVGLGIRQIYRPLVDVLRNNRIATLIVSRKRVTARNGETQVINERDFSAIARTIRRIASRHQRASLAERLQCARRELVSSAASGDNTADSDDVAVASKLRLVRSANAELSAGERRALAECLSLEAPALARHEPQTLYKLKRDFELAGMDRLIARLDADLLADRPESYWQKLLKLNEFILAMLFGYPIVVVRDQAHVGATKLDGSGGTIADFLVANDSTKSLALVEIKKPSTRLLGKAYRSGRFSPSTELNSAVIQMLDQRHELLVNHKFVSHKEGNVHGAVDCVLVTGRKPEDPDQLASFEMYRSSLRDVRIATFDEVLEKLRSLRNYLAAH